MKRGRPTILTKQLTRQICQLLSEGISITATCDALGVTESRYFDWIKNDEEFREQATRARANGKIALVRQILADKDWRARAWYLERCWPSEFGRCAERPIPVEPETDGVRRMSVGIFINAEGKPAETIGVFPIKDYKAKASPEDEPMARSNSATRDVESIESDNGESLEH